MVAAQFFTGACLFALLIVDVYCVPFDKGSNPAVRYGNSYAQAGPDFDPKPVAPLGHSPGRDSPQGVYATSYEHAPRYSYPASYGNSYAQAGPDFDPKPVAPLGHSPGHDAPQGVYATSYEHAPHYSYPASSGSAQPTNSDVQPLGLVAGGEGVSADAYDVYSSGPGFVSPPRPPPLPPVYHAGELSKYERTAEHGLNEQETQEQGSPPAPPYLPVAENHFTHPAQPAFPQWGFYPYYYDYMFLTGQYPPGTLSHASSSYEHGRNSWQDVHYVREHAPYNPGPVQHAEPFTGSADYQKNAFPRQPVKVPVAYRQDAPVYHRNV